MKPIVDITKGLTVVALAVLVVDVVAVVVDVDVDVDDIAMVVFGGESHLSLQKSVSQHLVRHLSLLDV